MSRTKVAVSRRQVLAFRAGRQGLARTQRNLIRLRVLDLGVQDTPAGAARLAIAARLDVPAAELAPGGGADPMADERLAMVWSVRGAPHLHRAADVPRMTRALWPTDDADAGAKLSWNAGRVSESGLPPVEAVRQAAEAVAQVVEQTWPKGRATGKRPPIGKSPLSSEVTKLLPEGLVRFCEPCQSVHVHEQLLRLAAAAGGLGVADTSPVTFAPLPERPGVPDGPGDPSRLVQLILGLHGPAGIGDVAGYLGTTRSVLKPHWPASGLVEVEVEDVKGPTWIPKDLLDDLIEADPMEELRLLPPGDPMLQGRDRELLVPDPDLRKLVWKALGNPGLLWSEGDVAGSWRPKATGKKLTVIVEPFRPLARYELDGLEEEAHRAAEVRGLREAVVKLPD